MPLVSSFGTNRSLNLEQCLLRVSRSQSNRDMNPGRTAHSLSSSVNAQWQSGKHFAAHTLLSCCPRALSPSQFSQIAPRRLA